MKFVEKIVMIICVALIVDLTKALVENSVEHEKCCPMTPKCHCPQNQPPVFDYPWKCIDGALKRTDDEYYSYDGYEDDEDYANGETDEASGEYDDA